MFMKKFLFFLILILSLTLVSCGGTEPDPNNKPGDDPITNPTVVYYTVEFLVEGNVIYTCKVEEGQAATPPAIDPSLYGVEFLEWDTDEYLCVTKDLKVNAKVKSLEGEWFTVEFYVNGNLVDFYRVLKGSSVTPPEINPNDYEMEFVGWDSDAYNRVECDLIINAIFKDKDDKTEPQETFLVEFYFMGELLYSTRVEYGSSVTPPTVNGDKYNAVFLGWNTDEYNYVTSDLRVEAEYQTKEKAIYIEIDGDIINPNSPYIIYSDRDLEYLNLEDFGYSILYG